MEPVHSNVLCVGQRCQITILCYNVALCMEREVKTHVDPALPLRGAGRVASVSALDANLGTVRDGKRVCSMMRVPLVIKLLSPP